MVTKDAFTDRRQALEDEFFHRVDERLIANMKAKTELEANRKQLAEVTGITDAKLIDELLATGANAETVAALSLVPLVLVAWADGKVDPEEREPILAAAHEKGIADGTPAADLLEHWLTVKPKKKLALTWKHYITELITQMSDDSLLSLRADIMDRARAVADASGGVLGFVKTTIDERRVLSFLDEVLARDAALPRTPK
ncbi:hypothetical protein RMSM_04997 [Rhodopirellula maiorica SM1]|uniref:Uncharacterized protein n=1 Tax=Rhodopirellula maiorica SM1 TaxID=1265738 RepID=M5RRR0_9BACT|nr:hypothetical protein [Rhodopirellula maiorica]EMI18072.1 hypothetical protein RMSM_04997 [Rhodopirellula maiorica SM1]